MRLKYGKYPRNWGSVGLMALNAAVFGIGTAICGLGLYARGRLSMIVARRIF